MRWVLWMLLLANAGLLAWFANREPLPARAEAVTAADHVNRLLLLSEIDAAELRHRVAGSGPASAAAVPGAGRAAATRVCFSVGPVQTEAEAERMSAWLREQGGAAKLRVDERREISLYWVYFPPFASPAEASARLEEMRERGVEDIFSIRRGDMANAISLGVYSRQSSLDRRLRQLQAKGYEPSVVPRYRTKLATWYDARFGPGFEFPTERFTLAFPAAQVVSIACEGGAEGAPAQAVTAADPTPAGGTGGDGRSGAPPPTEPVRPEDAGAPAVSEGRG